MEIDINQLKQFLVKAKKATYANESAKEITPERPGFKELEYKEGIWSYRDSYSGFYSAPGQEVVRLNEKPVWAMAYCGGMTVGNQQNLDFAKETFGFLKEALSVIEPNLPARGPRLLCKSGWEYENKTNGSIEDFWGEEVIKKKAEPVFFQRYFGGLILGK